MSTIEQQIQQLLGGGQIDRSPEAAVAPPTLQQLIEGALGTQVEQVQGLPDRAMSPGPSRNQGASLLGFAKGMNNPIRQAQATVLGIISEGILAPLEGLVSLPGLSWESGANYLERAQENIWLPYERAALESGMTQNEIASQKVFGEFVGFILPAVFSVGIVNAGLKGMSALRGVQQFGRLSTGVNRLLKPAYYINALQKYPIANGFVNETLAGAVYGGLLTRPEEGDTRLNGAMQEAAFFGLGRLGFNAIGWWGKHQLNYVRARSQTVNKILTGIERNSETGGVINAEALNNQTIADDVYEAYSELEVIQNSVSAMQHLIEGGDNTAAMIMGLRDASFSKGPNVATVNLINAPSESLGIKELTRVTIATLDDVLGDAYVHQALDNPITGRRQLFTSPRGQGLNGQQTKDFKREGYFIGQRVFTDAGEAIVSGFKGARGAARRVVTTSMDGGSRVFKPAEMRSAFTSENVVPFTEQVDNLYGRFRDEYSKRLDDAFHGKAGVSELEAIELAQKGELGISSLDRLDNQTPGTVNFPEEIGAAPNGLPKPMEAQRQSIMQRLQEMSQQSQALAQAGEEEAMALLQREAAQLQGQLSILNEFTPEAVINDIATSGFNSTRLNFGFPDVPIGEVFDDIARATDLDPQEYQVIKSLFIRKYTSEFLALAPEADRALLSSVIKRTDELVAGMDEIPVRVATAYKGMRLMSNFDQTNFVVRDAMSGKDFTRGSIGEVRDFLRLAVRDSPDLVANDIPLMNRGVIPSFTNNVIPETLLGRSDDYVFGEGTETVRRNIFSIVDRMFKDVEGVTNIPLHQISSDISRQLVINQQQTTLVTQAIDKITKPFFSRSSRVKNKLDLDTLSDVWVKLDTELGFERLNLMTNEEVGEATLALGFSKAEANAIKALDKALEVVTPKLNEVVEGTGREMMVNHYKFLRLAANQVSDGGKSLTGETARLVRDTPLFEWMVENQALGKIASSELNPLLVIDRFVDEVYNRVNLKPALDRLRSLRDLPMNSVTIEQGQAIRAANPSRFAKPDSKEAQWALGPVLRGTVDKFISHYEFGGRVEYPGIVKFMNNFLDILGVKISQSTVEQMIQTSAQLMYGATLGFRSAPVVLNSIQNAAIGQPLWGSKHYGRGLERAFALDGWKRPTTAGAISPERNRRFVEVSSDVVRAQGEELITRTRDTPLAKAAQGFFVGTGVIANSVKSFSEFGLRAFGHIDEVNRAVAFHSQVSLVEETMERLGGAAALLADDALAAKFAEIALVGHHPVVRKTFFEQLRRFGAGAAEDYIGVEGSKLTNFSYGQGLGPQALQEGTGRLLGMFGSHPLWMLNYTRHIYGNSTLAQKAGITARLSAFMGAVGLVGYEYDFNPFKFMPISFPAYTGGPVLDIIDNAMAVINSPYSTKLSSLGFLLREGVAIHTPGMVAGREMSRAYQAVGGLGPNMENLPYMMVAFGFSKPEPSPLVDYSLRDSWVFDTKQRKHEPTTAYLLRNPAQPDVSAVELDAYINEQRAANMTFDLKEMGLSMQKQRQTLLDSFNPGQQRQEPQSSPRQR